MSPNLMQGNRIKDNEDSDQAPSDPLMENFMDVQIKSNDTSPSPKPSAMRYKDKKESEDGSHLDLLIQESSVLQDTGTGRAPSCQNINTFTSWQKPLSIENFILGW